MLFSRRLDYDIPLVVHIVQSIYPCVHAYQIMTPPYSVDS